MNSGPITVGSLRASAAADANGWNINIVKIVIDACVEPLTGIFNKCVEKEVFADELKIVRVVPVYKKGYVESVDNYKPISILPTISKIFGKIIALRLSDYFEKISLLDSIKRGYRAGRSTTAFTDVSEVLCRVYYDHEIIQ